LTLEALYISYRAFYDGCNPPESLKLKIMTASKDDKEFTHYIVDLMQGIGPVNAKRMFGGYGIFLDGLMFALISDGLLYLKADTENKEDFIKHKLGAFSYIKKGKECHLSYFQSPEDALEDPEIMNSWARLSYAAALRTATKKIKK